MKILSMLFIFLYTGMSAYGQKLDEDGIGPVETKTHIASKCDLSRDDNPKDQLNVNDLVPPGVKSAADM